ncbi:hypothetical protein BBJ28_00013582 [Nothophytophthora sp. Chile5]|nr:hypothetical protein BBJ28_00013582 [Nothophytophthora sp. Chile5]
MSLNCLNTRARLETESELEAASKLVERAFNRIQKTETKSERVERSIREARTSKTTEMEKHLQWLSAQKARLESELSTVDTQLAEKKMLLHERTN